MTVWDGIGYLASGLVLLAFYMKAMVPLRIVALGSNLAFMAYGLGLGLKPVLVLHALLLPLNGLRLWQVVRSDRSSDDLSSEERRGADPTRRSGRPGSPASAHDHFGHRAGDRRDTGTDHPREQAPDARRCPQVFDSAWLSSPRGARTLTSLRCAALTAAGTQNRLAGKP